MKQLKRYMIVLGVLCTSSIVSAQSKNRITIQTGLFHCFFDGSPLMNINYPNEGTPPFNGLLINSLEIEYRRRFNEKSALGIEYDYFYETYHKNMSKYPIEEPVIGDRLWSTVKVNYYRTLPVNNQFNFVYGAGLNFRTGSESIIVNRFPLGNFNGHTVYEVIAENIGRNDIGLNAFGGIDYTPLKWLTISTKIDFLSSVFIWKTDARERMKEVYHSPQFPSRYDLSFNLGVGFNF